MLFNINETVRVKLTETGIAELRRQHEELKALFPTVREFTPPETDTDGWSKHQLWSLMQALGHLCVMGCALPFETTIDIPKEHLSET